MEFKSSVGKYIDSSNIETSLRRMHPGYAVTKGGTQFSAQGTLPDMEWNHLDQAHRNFVHDAYHDSLRVATGKDFAFSVTRFKNWPVFIPVFDARIDRGTFYQCITIFGLLFCYQICRMSQKGDQVVQDIEWYIVTHRFLKFLHKPFSRRLSALQAKQSAEDLVIRERRFSLRKLGFRFKTDEPDYLNSNVLSDCISFPNLDSVKPFPVSELSSDKRELIKVGPVELLAQKNSQGVVVWPAICPHEGAEMTEDHLCEGVLACPWHGRKFRAVQLKDGGNGYRLGNVEVLLRNGMLQLNYDSTAFTPHVSDPLNWIKNENASELTH